MESKEQTTTVSTVDFVWPPAWVVLSAIAVIVFTAFLVWQGQ